MQKNLQVPRFQSGITWCTGYTALYDLKQAPKAWYHKIDAFFLSLGFHHWYADNNICLFPRYLVCLIILYVNDLLITRSLASKIEQLLIVLKISFEMTDLGLLHYFLGEEVYHSHADIVLKQHRYLRQLLETYGMANGRPLSCDHVQWIQTQSYLVRLTLPCLKISQNIEG